MSVTGAPPTATVSLPGVTVGRGCAPGARLGEVQLLADEALDEVGQLVGGQGALADDDGVRAARGDETECLRAPVAAALRSWKAWSLSMAKTRSGVAA